jgi:predicted ATPase/DNA-binding NarL/FixJ family response regulator/DNA-binding XRE family transcriptional regulator
VESPAARLAGLRARLGLSQEQLARELGVSFATVNRWETGHTQMSARAVSALAEFEARQAAQSQPPPTDTLPVSQSSFVGRTRELAELSALLGSSRLITLIGPGGAGKTRLAIEAIHRHPPAKEVVFIPLERLRALESLVAAVAFALRVRDQRGVSVTAAVEAALRDAPRLIVLDGAEHLRSEVAELVSTMLTSVPGLRIVVTSRLLLGVPGEVCWTVPPLACPSAAAPASDVASSDAVQLFMARAAERLPGFSTADVPPHAIAELCRRLDALPLAIELMAGWVGTLSVQEILQQQAVLLNEDPAAAGGRGLAEVMRTSYELLAPEQQRLLPVLSVFAGAFTLDDARAVSDVAGPALPRSIRTLVDSSWLAVTHGGERNRFTMLETMRTFAGALLDERPDAREARGRHAAHFAELARGSETGLGGADAATWKATAQAAVGDFNVALRWADENADVDLGLELSAALWRWWLVSGRLAAGRSWLNRFLAQAGQRRDERTGAAFCSAAILAAENGDYQEAIRQGRVALAIFEQLDAPRRTALAATVLGSAHRYLGDQAAARRCFERAMELREAAGDPQGVSVAMNNLALLELDDGNTGRALELFERTLVIKRQLGEQQSLALGLNNLADVLIKLGRLDAAAAAVAEAAELATGLGNPQLIGTTRCNQGDIAAKRQRWPEAVEHYAAAMLAHRQAGHANDAVLAMIGLGLADYQLGRKDEATRRLRDAEAIATQIANPQRLAEVRAALAEVGESSAGVLPDGLTARQAEVLRLLAGGMSNKQIAGELYLSPATVERHLATIYRKLSVAGRVEATRYAVRSGLAGPLPSRPPPTGAGWAHGAGCYNTWAGAGGLGAVLGRNPCM